MLKLRVLFFLILAGFSSVTYSRDTTSSFIRSMNQQQLQSLIDYLFEMDSIPSDLVREVNAAVAVFNNETSFVKNQETSDPSSIFCWKDMNARLDTTCIVKLTNEQHPCFTMPVNGIITCNFGWNKSYNHNGIDINLRRGDKVSSAFDGIVRFAKWENGYGNVVVIRHPNGLETLYAHLSKIKVKVGELVTSGDVVGLGGATGNATGNHLHFEVRLKSKPINPKYLIAFEDQKLISDTLIFKCGKLGWAAYPPDTREYIVQKGDTIFEVAKRFGLSAKTLAEQNCINQWLRLRPGQVITIVG
jgi:murein DD-endopeptidase MepM/ murein hydrolase activator NlpD